MAKFPPCPLCVLGKSKSGSQVLACEPDDENLPFNFGYKGGNGGDYSGVEKITMRFQLLVS